MNELKFGNKVVFLNGNPLTLPVRAADPGSAVQGDMYYNSVSQLVKFYDGSAWQEMSSGVVNLEGQVLNDGEILIGNVSNESAGVVPSGDVVISNAGVTSISAGVIVNADINASAGIEYSKLSIADGDLTIAKTNGLQTALDGKVDENVAITGDTKTKITYDAKGLVTAGADATTDDIAEGSNLYFTDSRAKTAAVADAIVDGVTDVAPSQNAVFDALALKAASSDLSSNANGLGASLVGIEDVAAQFTSTNVEGALVESLDAAQAAQADATQALSDAADAQATANAAIPASEKGANSGVATLDAGGKIPVGQLPSSVMEFKGNWDADTNSPTLIDGTGDAGDVYRVNVAGTQDLGSGSQTFAVGDWVVYNGTVWQKSNNSNAVMSVNGEVGVVVLDSDDIDEGVTNLYFSDERAQDAVGAMVDDSSKISLTYNDGTPSLVADIVAGSLVNADVAAGAGIEYTKLALTSSIMDSDVAPTAGIVYSKLDLATSILDTDIAAGAGIVYSKLNLAASIVDADIAAAAAIAYSKLSIADNDLTIAKTNGLQAALDGKVDENAPITGATKTKITYDAKGLVTAGDDAAIADITGLQDALDDKANDADVIKKDGSVAFTGDQDMGGNAITDSASVKLVAPKVNRSQDGTNFIEEQYVDAITLTGSATVNAMVYDSATFGGAHVEYMIKSNAGEIRTGKVYIASKPDGSAVSMSDQFSETADCEIALSADFSSPNIRLRATNSNGGSGTMRLDIKLIRA